jgi:hypothetical protein
MKTFFKMRRMNLQLHRRWHIFCFFNVLQYWALNSRCTIDRQVLYCLNCTSSRHSVFCSWESSILKEKLYKISIKSEKICNSKWFYVIKYYVWGSNKLNCENYCQEIQRNRKSFYAKYLQNNRRNCQ